MKRLEEGRLSTFLKKKEYDQQGGWSIMERKTEGWNSFLKEGSEGGFVIS